MESLLDMNKKTSYNKNGKQTFQRKEEQFEK